MQQLTETLRQVLLLMLLLLSELNKRDTKSERAPMYICTPLSSVFKTLPGPNLPGLSSFTHRICYFSPSLVKLGRVIHIATAIVVCLLDLADENSACESEC